MKRQKVLPSSDNRPIGVFDSGVGGLTVVKELVQTLPFEDIIYYGDTARVPYGTKSRNTIIKFSIENALFLLKQNVKLIVVACNTSSSVSLPALRRNFKVPVVGVIKPGAYDAVMVCRNKRIGVIATNATIRSNAYSREIARIDPFVKIFSQNCPLLVPVAEESLRKDKIIIDIIEYYLKPLKQKRIDTLVLGCTHYPLLKNLISKFMGDSIVLVDSAASTAEYVKDLLSKQGVLNKRRLKGNLKFFVSDEIENFKRAGERFLGRNIKSIRKVGHGI
ncbi:glutamate racemase [bacterium]|nr:MAG: glutamate racemase [bacterium]